MRLRKNKYQAEKTNDKLRFENELKQGGSMRTTEGDGQTLKEQKSEMDKIYSMKIENYRQSLLKYFAEKLESEKEFIRNDAEVATLPLLQKYQEKKEDYNLLKDIYSMENKIIASSSWKLNRFRR